MFDNEEDAALVFARAAEKDRGEFLANHLKELLKANISKPTPVAVRRKRQSISSSNASYGVALYIQIGDKQRRLGVYDSLEFARDVMNAYMKMEGLVFGQFLAWTRMEQKPVPQRIEVVTAYVDGKEIGLFDTEKEALEEANRYLENPDTYTL
jgi:leucyl aminopeptidase (aminopeptidase T)